MLLYLFFTSCALVDFDSDLDESRELIERAEEVCSQNINRNKVLAKKQCFPVLKNKKILMKLKEISDISEVTLMGEVSSSAIVWFEPNKLLKNRILKDPNLFKVGEKIWVKGDFTNFNYGGTLNFYTLTNCEVTQHKSTKK